MYIPRPIGIRPVIPARNPRELAAEVLALTKMNWNQTRLDGRLPATLRTANQVKSVLRRCDDVKACCCGTGMRFADCSTGGGVR
ncbi:hypothetical protein GCM10010383_72530 [Streptomyces lomondensis]|uniref:Transposase n=1 Tax=Streptomyces lomondensis TaxID=68229 RepID=A0ABQ2XS62_9ACTN|nr:hypothetical protein GCM10010383_72530 [Streptomyces lomondensis]